MHKKLILGYSKLLLTTGSMDYNFQATVEIFDLSSNTASCKTLPQFPRYMAGALGGLNFKEEPFVCGGIVGYSIFQDCWTYQAGAWVTTPSLTNPRAVSSYSDSPFPGHNVIKLFTVVFY
jgi:hypothetical protein